MGKEMRDLYQESLPLRRIIRMHRVCRGVNLLNNVKSPCLEHIANHLQVQIDEKLSSCVVVQICKYVMDLTIESRWTIQQIYSIERYI